MPDTCVPTVTDVTGSMVPVAVMLVWMFVFSTLAVSNDTFSSFFPPRRSNHAIRITAITPMAIQPFFPIFCIYYFFYCLQFIVNGSQAITSAAVQSPVISSVNCEPKNYFISPS